MHLRNIANVACPKENKLEEICENPFEPVHMRIPKSFKAYANTWVKI